MASEPGGATHAPGDDFVAEVSDLNHAPLAGVASSAATASAGELPEAKQPAALAPAGERVTFGQRLSRQQRRARQLSIAGVVALALVLVLGSVPAMRDRAALLLPHPPPVATLEAGAGYVYIAPGAPWATVAIDGAPVSHLPVIGIDPPLWLPPGHHTIAWHAPPFAPGRCVLSTPIAGTDTCTYDRVRLNQPEATPSQWIVTLFPTLALLSGAQRAALLRATQSALDMLSSSATVRPGELFGERYPPNAATQPLLATLSFQLVTTALPNESCANGGPSYDCTELGQDCVQFCTLPLTGSTGDWSVLAVVNLRWAYTTATGQLMGLFEQDVPQWEGSTGFLIPLRITWDGVRWHVVAATGAPTAPQLSYESYVNPPATAGLEIDPACLALSHEIGQSSVLSSPTDSLYDLLTWRYIAAPTRADGCVATATISAYTTLTPPSVAPPAPLVLRRFGYVLAANAVAHRLWPNLPVADAYEKNMAQQIVVSAGSTATGGDGSSR